MVMSTVKYRLIDTLAVQLELREYCYFYEISLLSFVFVYLVRRWIDIQKLALFISHYKEDSGFGECN